MSIESQERITFEVRVLMKKWEKVKGKPDCAQILEALRPYMMRAYESDVEAGGWSHPYSKLNVAGWIMANQILFFNELRDYQGALFWEKLQEIYANHEEGLLD